MRTILNILLVAALVIYGTITRELSADSIAGMEQKEGASETIEIPTDSAGIHQEATGDNTPGDSGDHKTMKTASPEEQALYYMKIADNPNTGYATADSLFHLAARLFQDAGNDYMAVQCFNHLSVLSFNKGDNRNALLYANRALELAKEAGLEKSLAINYSNISLMYIKLGDYEKANEYNFSALRIFREMGDSLQIARCKLSIGSIYIMLVDYQKALDYITSARDDFKSIDDQKGYSVCLTNIGSVYTSKGDYKKALPIFYEAVAIDEKNDDLDGISSNYTNIGKVYYQLCNNTKAMDYYRQAMTIDKKTGDKSGLAGIYLNMSRVMVKEKNTDKALVFCNKSLELLEETGEMNMKRQVLEQKSEILKSLGRISQAYETFREATSIKDSIFNIEKAAKIAMLEEKYLNEKLANENLELRYTNELQETRITNQLRMNRTYLAALLILFTAIVIVFIQFRKKIVAYRFIARKNLDLVNKEKELKTLKSRMNEMLEKEKPAFALPDDEKEKVLHKLEKLMDTDKIFTRPDLTIDKLAKRLATNRTYLSKIINDVFDKNYSNYINEHRVKEAMRLFADPEIGDKYSIEAVAREAGFNTVTHFNSVFKKYTGITPSMFRKTI